MPSTFRTRRRHPLPLSELAARRLRQFAARCELAEGEALSFLLEHLGSVTDDDALTHRLRLFKAALHKSAR